MAKKLSNFFHILKETFFKWKKNDPFRESAVIAYYAIFSLPSLLVLLISVVNFLFKKDVLSGEIARQVEGLMGKETANQVSDIIAKTAQTKAGWLAGTIAVVTILSGSVGVFVELQKSLDKIWEVKQKEHLSFFNKMKSNLFSFGLVLSIGFLLLVSMVVSTALAAFSHWIEGIFSVIGAYLMFLLEFAVSFAVISTLFALMFKYLADIKISWRSSWMGAFLTAALFILGKYALSIYFGKVKPESAYGAAGSVILILLWASYSSMIVFFGAQFTKQYTLVRGEQVDPTKIAEKTD